MLVETKAPAENDLKQLPSFAATSENKAKEDKKNHALWKEIVKLKEKI